LTFNDDDDDAAAAAARYLKPFFIYLFVYLQYQMEAEAFDNLTRSHIVIRLQSSKQRTA